ncbi:MAG: TIGR01548 family HAD-type hydrolase, partial [Gemmatimonadetes bacterium]|nr:TIGR01548 family HAD-type hydrolase [Gemmatimonadota bacterium]
PDAADLESRLAADWGVSPDSVVVTAGADEALDRICRAYLDESRSIVLPRPTFVMLEKYVDLARGRRIAVDWRRGSFPARAFLEAMKPDTAVLGIVTPNNPTGMAATIEEIRILAEGAPDTLVLCDLAYAEYAGEDPTKELLTFPNVIVTRTVSKAWGLAGLRIGYAVGAPELIAPLRAYGGPYPVSSISLRVAQYVLETSAARKTASVARIRRERSELLRLFDRLGFETCASEANFLFVRFPDAGRVRESLLQLGVAVRAFPEDPALADSLRITLPGDAENFETLKSALRTLFEPEAILFDMDGVIADVSRSYRACIVKTASSFGADVTPADVERAKQAGGANCDWTLTERLIRECAGTSPGLDAVTVRFQEFYRGTGGEPGLGETESLIGSRESIVALRARFPLAIVTGRPRDEARSFLEKFGLDPFFDVVIAREDGPPKPDPAPLRLAMETLGVSRVWMIGDTVDDVRAARAAGALPLGVTSTAADATATEVNLRRAGATWVGSVWSEIEGVLS